MQPNRLINETSPYLLQHAHNPVDWHPWGEEAFAKARRENKPILLSVGYSACHWCHVMERESFENEEIAALMNEHFVNIKVDREERPDLDEVYMNAVQMLTGRGGWPMTVFLTPDGHPFYGGTYFPPADRQGVPGFPRILRAVAHAYRENPQDVQKSVDQIVAALNRLSDSREGARSFSADALLTAAETLAESYDHRYGGLGQAPKFPNSGVLDLFLRAYRQADQPRFLEMVTHTLTKMGEGGIYDHLGGGFHRYSVDERWLVPHFEKMLHDNAQLARSYADAFRATGEPFFKGVVQGILEYLLREMFHPDGGFYATQDADSEGHEGKFFIWTEAEVSRILGAEAAEIFCRIYDVTEMGNFEGENILHPTLTLDQAAGLFRRDAAEVARIVAGAKQKLFAEREKRIKPFRDEKILISWNGLMLSGLAAAYEVVEDPRYRRAAEKTVEFLFTKMVGSDGSLLHVYKDGQAKFAAFLDDYAFLIVGLLDFYEAVLDRSLLQRADELAEAMVGQFWDDVGGGFFYTGTRHEKLISRSKPAFDSSVPSGNSMAAQALLRLHYYTGKEHYLKRAEKVLRLYYEAMAQQPFGFTHMLAALDFFCERPKEIVVIGNVDDSATRELLGRIHRTYLPNRTLQAASPGEPLAKISPLLEGKTQLAGKPTVYVCQNFTCSLPVTGWEELEKLLRPENSSSRAS